jgi:hypothetical protein
MEIREIREKRYYRIIRRGQRGLNISVSLPPNFVNREALRRGLSISQFVKDFVAVAEDCDSYLIYRFVSKEEAGYARKWD